MRPLAPLTLPPATHLPPAVSVPQAFRKEQGLEALPLYGIGVSVGGGFILKLPQYLKLDGILSEVLGPRPDTYRAHKFKHGAPREAWVAGGGAWMRCTAVPSPALAAPGTHRQHPCIQRPCCAPTPHPRRAATPPTVFVAMDQDWGMARRISLDAAKLRGLGTPVATVRVPQKQVTPDFFSRRRCVAWLGLGAEGARGGWCASARPQAPVTRCEPLACLPSHPLPAAAPCRRT